jgi:hypothetical protein
MALNLNFDCPHSAAIDFPIRRGSDSGNSNAADKTFWINPPD